MKLVLQTPRVTQWGERVILVAVLALSVRTIWRGLSLVEHCDWSMVPLPAPDKDSPQFSSPPCYSEVRSEPRGISSEYTQAMLGPFVLEFSKERHWREPSSYDNFCVRHPNCRHARHCFSNKVNARLRYFSPGELAVYRRSDTEDYAITVRGEVAASFGIRHSPFIGFVSTEASQEFGLELGTTVGVIAAGLLALRQRNSRKHAAIGLIVSLILAATLITLQHNNPPEKKTPAFSSCSFDTIDTKQQKANAPE